MDKEKAFWRKVLWSDETKVGLFGHNDQNYVWRREGEAFNIKNTVRHGVLDAVGCSNRTMTLNTHQ